jgi:polysaccharide deacetylase family protein (PEP-CTERM system associated)
MINALSFDIEDWFHILDIPNLSNTENWGNLPQIVESQTYRILETLDQFGVKATFFIVGWIADQYPDLVRQIADLGHEIGSHSYWHRTVSGLRREEFAEDIHASVQTLESISGRKVLGFRAPGFTLTQDCPWAFDVLLDEGIRYDASLVPYRPQSFNVTPKPHRFRETLSGREIMELPVSALPLGKLSIPYCGGGYLRLMPSFLLYWLMTLQNQRGLPNVVYLHPRDFAVDCPRTKLPPLRYFRTYHGISSTQAKLEFILSNFEWDTCASLLGFRLEKSLERPFSQILPLAA